MVGDIFGDQRAALLSGRTQPKKASFRLGRRELILTHETRSQCPAGPVKCFTSSYNFVNSHPPLNRLFQSGRFRRGTVPFRATPGVAGSLPALPPCTPRIHVNKSTRHSQANSLTNQSKDTGSLRFQ